MFGRKLLGISIGDRSLVAAEVRVNRSGIAVRRTVEISLPDGLPDARSCGRSLKNLLRGAGIRARTAVFGIPLSWTLSRMKTAPQADAVSLARILRLEAEQEFSIPVEDLAIDFVPAAPAADRQRLLVVATPRAKVQAVLAVARAAGLRAEAILPSAIAVAVESATESSAACIVVDREETTLVVSWQGAPLLLWHLGPGPADSACSEWAQQVVAEARRGLAAITARPDGYVEPAEIILWDDAGLSDDAQAALSAGLPAPVRIYRCVSPSEEGTAGCAVPAAVAAAAARARDGIVDFARSRLVERRPSRTRILATRIAIVAAAGAALGLAAYFDLRGQQQHVADLQKQLAMREPEVARIRELSSRVAAAQQWRQDRPGFLDCLRQLTFTFPVDGGIWATTLAIQQDMRGTIAGKASSDRLVLDVLDRMKGEDRFTSVKLAYLRGGGTTSREVAFAITFTFQPATTPATAAGEGRSP